MKEYVKCETSILDAINEYPLLKRFLNDSGYFCSEKINNFLKENIVEKNSSLTSETINLILSKVEKKYPELLL